ncbi:hypothetical protein BH11ACT4_BH11ACT4_13150 [soil metagenome]
MPPRVLTITGPTGSGKGELLKIFDELRSDDFEPVLIQKFTTRKRRANDGPEVKCVRSIPKNCDIAYEQYGVRYGFRSKVLWEHVAAGRTPLVIVNDIRAVEDIKDRFGAMARAVYLFRDAPSEDRVKQLSLERGVDDVAASEYAERHLKSIMIHRIFIENVHVFDWVIINVGSTTKRMRAQVTRLVRGEQSQVKGIADVVKEAAP